MATRNGLATQSGLQLLSQRAESRVITVVNSTKFAIPGADPYTYIIGNIIGVEQNGVIRPVVVVGCAYDSANTRTLITVSPGCLSTSIGLRVWFSYKSDGAYMMHGGLTSVASYIPGGMAAGASPSDAAMASLGFTNTQNRTLRNAGSVVYSNDYTYLGGNPLKIASGQALAQLPLSGAAGGPAIPYSGGMFARVAMYISANPTGNFHLYYRAWNGNADMGQVRINTSKQIEAYEYGNSAYGMIATSAWTVPIGSWFDFAWESDIAAAKYRFWINGVPQAPLTGSTFTIGYFGGGFLVGNVGTFDNYTATFTAGSGAGVPVYLHDYLMLNYAPIRADGVTLPVPAQPFGCIGLREAA